MSTTSTTAPAPPAAQDIGGRLEYQLACNRAMFAAGHHRPGTGPVFSQAELRAMDWSFTAGLLPTTFVEAVMQQRTAAA